MKDWKDYSSKRDIKYCAGCGDYGILMGMKKAFAELELDKEKTYVVSGIGCSSRTPYYLDTFGFNTVHGRAGTIASGIKIANPELSVWQCTGDGDCLSIGGNHIIHEVRRNVDINILLFNNQIYGMTKGQASPTTPQRQITKTSPYGTIERPVVPGELLIGAGCTFFARTLDKKLPLTTKLLQDAYHHKGTSVVECLVNCLVWNDGAYSKMEYTEIYDGDALDIDGETIVFDSHNKEHAEKVLRYYDGKKAPMALGVIYQEDIPTYEDLLYEQMKK